MPEDKPAALVSLSDRSGLEQLGGTLRQSGFNIIATTGTAAELRQHGIECSEVEDITAFPAILDGRVKTLHPKIFGGLLAQRDSAGHARELVTHGVPSIQVLAVTLYPFEATAARPDVTAEEVIENIDIGGVALLRAGAKNYQHVSVLSQPKHYDEFADAMRSGGPDLALRKRWAGDAMALVARYDSAIAAYYSEGQADGLTDTLALNLPLASRLRYGENPWEQGAFYQTRDPAKIPSQLSGKTLSYNNLLDVDSCLRLLAPIERPRGFPITASPASTVCAAIVKHTVPCGFAAAPTAKAALEAALGADPISAFGGIVAIDAPLDEESADLLKPRFLEVVAAPDFTPAALAVLQTKKNLRVLRYDPALPGALRSSLTLRSALGGVLAEQPDSKAAPDEWTVMTEKQPSPQQWRDLLFGFRAVRQVKSNAAVVVKAETTLGVCGGQTNRVAAVELACNRAGAAVVGAVLATDGFFPFADGIEAAISAGIAAVVAPSGSIRDAEVIAAARHGGIALVFASRRYFLH